jgi:hypothetical protein
MGRAGEFPPPKLWEGTTLLLSPSTWHTLGHLCPLYRQNRCSGIVYSLPHHFFPRSNYFTPFPKALSLFPVHSDRTCLIQKFGLWLGHLTHLTAPLRASGDLPTSHSFKHQGLQSSSGSASQVLWTDCQITTLVRETQKLPKECSER